MDILYSDNHLLAVNKPADLLTQPSGTDQDSLEAQAKAWIKVTDNKPGNVYLHAVHRLDKPVSGIVLFARTSKALTRLNSAIRERETRKTYLALVKPIPELPEQTLIHHMLHGDFEARIVKPTTPGAQQVKLSYRVLDSASGLVEVSPETGRYHQIRLQLSAIGSPIVGDTRYAGASWPHAGIALHHHRLELTHPVTQEKVVIIASLPNYWPIKK